MNEQDAHTIVGASFLFIVIVLVGVWLVIESNKESVQNDALDDLCKGHGYEYKTYGSAILGGELLPDYVGCCSDVLKNGIIVAYNCSAYNSTAYLQSRGLS